LARQNFYWLLSWYIHVHTHILILLLKVYIHTYIFFRDSMHLHFKSFFCLYYWYLLVNLILSMIYNSSESCYYDISG
jgi:hypothetical protein